jgi:hypothetical protein
MRWRTNAFNEMCLTAYWEVRFSQVPQKIEKPLDRNLKAFCSVSLIFINKGL